MEIDFANQAESETEQDRGCLFSDRGGIMEEERSWSDLPYDLLTEIISRIYCGDRVVFRSVCRSWNAVIPLKTNYNTSMACLSGIYLMYPDGKKIIRPVYDECHRAALFTVPGATVHAVRDGWFLMTARPNFFLFHPLTNTKFDLPELEGLPRATYISAPPTSANWTLITVSEKGFPKITISAIKRGEDTWSCHEFESVEWTHAVTDGSRAVICKGLYYFLGKHAELLIHDPVKKSFSFHEPSKSIIPEQLRVYDAQHYLLESDGKVLAVFVSFDGSLLRICKWNRRKERWEAVRSLGDKMLYVSGSSAICETATVRGTGNKIYFPRLMDDVNCLFYSLTTKKYHTFAGSSYRNFNGSKYPRNPIWIKL